MYRAITLIELLTTLTIMVMAIYVIIPPYFRIQDYIALNTEIENIKTFFYHVHLRASYTSKSYSVNIVQHPLENRWCMIAIAKENSHQIECNCFQWEHCSLKQNYLLYQSHYPSVVKSKNLYPNHFTNFESNSGRTDERCLKIIVNQLNHIIQLNKLGIINVAEKNNRSECKSL